MKQAIWVTTMCLVAALILPGLPGLACQVEPGPPTQAEAVPSNKPPLLVMTEQLRIAIYVATLAVLSPTLTDQRLHAQQVVNILEGKNGKHFVPLSSSGDDEGLIARANALFQRLKKEKLDPKVRERARFVAKNILIFLNLALDESLHSLSRRQLKAAAEDMLKVYAYLSAALGPDSAPTYLGGLLLLLRFFPSSPPVGEGARP